MNPRHYLKITSQDGTGRTARVELDGHHLEGLSHLELTMDAAGINTVDLTLIGVAVNAEAEVEVDHEGAAHTFYKDYVERAGS